MTRRPVVMGAMAFLVAAAWFLVGGVAAGAAGQALISHAVVHDRGGAVIPASSGQPVKVPEPTYRWHGLIVPVGACGAIIGGRAMVLSCGDKRVVAYRRAMAERDWGTAGALAAAAILGGGLLALRRMRRIPRPGGEM